MGWVAWYKARGATGVGLTGLQRACQGCEGRAHGPLDWIGTCHAPRNAHEPPLLEARINARIGNRFRSERDPSDGARFRPRLHPLCPCCRRQPPPPCCLQLSPTDGPRGHRILVLRKKEKKRQISNHNALLQHLRQSFPGIPVEEVNCALLPGLPPGVWWLVGSWVRGPACVLCVPVMKRWPSAIVGVWAQARLSVGVCGRGLLPGRTVKGSSVEAAARWRRRRTREVDDPMAHNICCSSPPTFRTADRGRFP